MINCNMCYCVDSIDITASFVTHTRDCLLHNKLRRSHCFPLPPVVLT